MSAIESRARPAGPGATRPPSDSSPSQKPSPPTTSEPPPTAGQIDFGENKVQEALEKMDQTADLPIRWHLVGHLQSNKARKAGARFDVVHSVDEAALAARLDEGASAAGRSIELLAQVDLAGEPTKHGAHADELPADSVGAPGLRPPGSSA